MKRATRLAFAAACVFAAVAAIADPPSAFTLRATPICNAQQPAIVLEWGSSDGANHYDITKDNATLAQGVSSDDTSFIDSASDVGTSHTYVVTAVNDEGSTKSNPVTASAPPSVCTARPSAPTLTGNASCDASTSPHRAAVNLSWSASSGATSYQVVRGGEVIQSTTATSFTDFTVAAGGSYQYVIRAINSGGMTDSNQISISVAADICGIAPGAFSVSTAASCSGTAAKVTVSWTASSGATSYIVERNALAISASLSASTHSFDDANPPTDVPLAYDVRATNDAGSTESNTSTTTVPDGLCGNVIPETPVLSVVLFCTSQLAPAVRLTWTESRGATSYLVVRDGMPLTIVNGAQSVSYDDMNVTVGQTYFYQLRATNSGASATSNAVSVAVTASICRALAVSNVSLSAATAKSGDSLIVSFLVTNRINNVSAPTTLAIRIGTLAVTAVSIPSIGALQTVPFTQTITVPALASGTYFITVATLDDPIGALSPALQIVGIPSRRRAVGH